jgi:hypothetical protein
MADAGDQFFKPMKIFVGIDPMVNNNESQNKNSGFQQIREQFFCCGGQQVNISAMLRKVTSLQCAVGSVHD